MPTTYDRIDLLEMKLKIAVEALGRQPCRCDTLAPSLLDVVVERPWVSSTAVSHCQVEVPPPKCSRCATLKAIEQARLP